MLSPRLPFAINEKGEAIVAPQDASVTFDRSSKLDRSGIERRPLHHQFVKVPFHDKLMMQGAPFDSAPIELGRTIKRYAGILWGDDRFAFLIDREWKTRTEHRYAVSPA